MSWTEPDVAWLNDLKNQKHNLRVTEMIAGNVKNIKGVKKYDSSKFVVGL